MFHGYEIQFRDIRKRLNEIGSKSQTTDKFQDDVISFILDNSDKGDVVIEVGCYRGGLSTTLAYTCKILGYPLFLVDKSQKHLEITRSTVRYFGFNDVEYFLGTFADFVEQNSLDQQPLSVIIDGNHRYEFVMEDIRSLRRLDKSPYAVIFHDFSLRSLAVLDIAVDKAIFDSMSVSVPVQFIGVQIDENNTFMPTKSCPDEEKNIYWEMPGSEGAIIRLQDIPDW